MSAVDALATGKRLPLFDPELAMTLAEPPAAGPGWWAGAPGACQAGGETFVVYRIRRPRPVRGGEMRIGLMSERGLETIWSATKDDLGTTSIERSALAYVDGSWRLYVSYVDPADGRWRIDLLEAATPDGFDPAARRPVLTAASIGAEGVKDPWLHRLDGAWTMIASFAEVADGFAGTAADLHRGHDIYNTGHVRSASGLATSADGRVWRWEGSVLMPSDDGWDRYAARLNSAVRVGNEWLGFYDGSASVDENYEERCGLAASPDLRTWRRLRPSGPVVGAQHGPGSVRYVEALRTSDGIRYFFEYTRADGSHDLRTILVSE